MSSLTPVSGMCVGQEMDKSLTHEAEPLSIWEEYQAAVLLYRTTPHLSSLRKTTRGTLDSRTPDGLASSTKFLEAFDGLHKR